MDPATGTRASVDRRIAELGVVKATGELGVAALLFTYRCTIACRHCLFGAAPTRPNVVMSHRLAVDALAMLHDLGRVVHIAGGEAMMYWPEMAAVVAEACRHGTQPHFVETNASFAVTRDIVRERFAFLKDHGLVGLCLSADAFHQEWVPPDRVRRVRDVAVELFGAQNVFRANVSDADLDEWAAIARDPTRRDDYARTRYRPMLVGTAYDQFRHLYPDHAIADLPLKRASYRGEQDTRGCGLELDERIWEVHVDPYGNIQTNCGVILGTVADAPRLNALAWGRQHANPLVRILVSEGPFGLAEYARDRYGYVVPDRAVTRCSFCYETRRFLRSYHPDTFGPAEVYECGEPPCK